MDFPRVPGKDVPDLYMKYRPLTTAVTWCFAEMTDNSINWYPLASFCSVPSFPRSLRYMPAARSAVTHCSFCSTSRLSLTSSTHLTTMLIETIRRVSPYLLRLRLRIYVLFLCPVIAAHPVLIQKQRTPITVLDVWTPAIGNAS